MASLFWVGGSTAYDGTTNRLATSSGGTATVAVIASGDTVTFDGSSPAGAAVTTSAAISCTTMTLATGFTGSLTMSNALTVSGVLTVTQGTLNTNGQTCSWSSLSSSNSNTRTLTFGASAITITSGGTAWNTATTGGLTVTSNTATVTMSGAGATFSSGAKSFNGMSLSLTGSGTATISSGCTFANLTRTGTAAKNDVLSFGVASSQATTVTSTFTVTGNSLTNRVLVQTGTLGTQETITTTAFSFTNVDFMDMASAGAGGTWTGSSLGDCQGNAGITFTGAVSRFAVATGNTSATATWSATTAGAGGASVPLPQDTVTFDSSSPVGTYTFDMPRLGKDVTFSTFTGTASNSVTGVTTYGNLTLGGSMTLSGSQLWTLGGRGSQTLTNNTKAFSSGLTIASPLGTYTLQDAFALPTSSNFTVSDGTFDANNQTVTCGAVVSNSGRTRAIKMGTNTWTVQLTSSTLWLITSASLTLTPSSSTIVISDTGASAKTFAGGGVTYNNLSITGGGAGTVTLTGANTFNVFTIGASKTVILPSSTTTTVTNLNWHGSSGNLVTIQSSTSGTAATISSATGGIVCDWLSLKDSTATGGATFWAGANSTNVSGNTGWTFTAPAITKTAILSYSGSVPKTTTHLLPSASVSPVGSMIRNTIHFLGTAVLSFVGLNTRGVLKGLAANLSFGGSISKVVNRGLSAVSNFVGSTSRSLARNLGNITLGLTGNILRSTLRPLSGTMTTAGSVSKIANKNFTATTTFSGTVSRITQRLLSTTLNFIGLASRATQRTVGASLSFVGSDSHIRNLLLIASLSLNGAITKLTRAQRNATMDFIGNFQRSLAISRNASLGFSGQSKKQTQRTVTGSITPTTKMIRVLSKIVKSKLFFTGSNPHLLRRILPGANLSMTGNTARSTLRKFLASLGSSGSMITGHLFHRIFNAGLGLIGNTFPAFVLNRVFNANLTSSGTISKAVKRPLLASVGFTGRTAHNIRRILGSGLGFVGAIPRRTLRKLNASLPTIGGLKRLTKKSFVASSSFVGKTVRVTARKLTAQSSFTGSIVKGARKSLFAHLSSGGKLAKATLRIWRATLAPHSVSTKRTTRQLPGGSITPAGKINKRLTRIFRGAVTSVGSWQFLRKPDHHFSLVFNAHLTPHGATARSDQLYFPAINNWIAEYQDGMLVHLTDPQFLLLEHIDQYVAPDPPHQITRTK